MEIKTCNRCVMDTTDPSITFDGQGYCNYCTDVIKRMDTEYFPNEEGKRKLNQMMETIKATCKNDPYDCMVGVSGGRDSSYVLFLGHQYGLRMLCVHVDDGLDTKIAKKNIENLCKAANAKLILIQPNLEQYKDITRCLFRASVPNLALAQDNILLEALRDTVKKYHIKYSLSGGNFAMESILQRGTDPINSGDCKHLKALHKQFGEGSINELQFSTMFGNYISRRYFDKAKTLYPLNYIDYQMEHVLKELQAFSGYEYYGGKHYESILTRFLQCYYLPKKFNFDKRKSHFSSLIVSGQLTREVALERLSQSPYTSPELLKSDMDFLSEYLDMSEDEFQAVLQQKPKNHSDYPTSVLNHLAPVARCFRKWLG